MARKISSAIDGPLVLTESDDPLIVTSTGTITSTGANSDGIDGAASTAWIITNEGTVSSAWGRGISLAGAGVLTNFGVISGAGGGFATGGFGLLANKGSISAGGAGSGLGVDFGGGGVVTNGKGASIAGLLKGVEIAGGFGTVVNHGTIRPGPVRDGIGVSLADGGVVANGRDGSINGNSSGFGVEIIGGIGTVANEGSINGGIGVSLASGGLVTNGKGGSISGTGFAADGGIGVKITGGSGIVTNHGVIGGSPYFSAGVEIADGWGMVTNSGSISAETGVSLASGGLVINGKGGSITGGPATILGRSADGVLISGGSGMITNEGTISGATHSVLFDAGTNHNRLVIEPGAVFNGSADATAATNSTIELTQGTGAISGIGNGQFLGFNTLVADRGANWTLNGPNTIETVLNDGKLDVSGGLAVSTAVDPNSTGLFKLDGSSVLEIAAAIGANSKVGFYTGSELVVDDFTLFGQNVGTSHYAGSLLKDFGGSTIDLKDFGIAGLQEGFSAGSGLLQLTNSASQMATLAFQTSSLGTGTFHFASDGSSGIFITYS